MYYDERKERLQELKELYNDEKEGVSGEERRNRLRSKMRNEWGDRGEYRKVQERASNIRVLLLIGILLVLGYFIFNGIDEVDTVVKKLW